MHYISTLETVFVIVHFVSEIFSSPAAAVFHLRLVAGVWGLVCQLVIWLLGMGDCLNPVPRAGTRWSDAEWPRQDDWKMLRFSMFVFRIPRKSISQHKYQGPFHFQPNRLLFSDTSCQRGRRVEQRISIPTRKNGLPEHNCPCSCHIFLLYLITELPMNFSWDKGIKHLSS